MKDNFNYDMDAVIEFCEDAKTRTALENLVTDLNDLRKYLNGAENSFHCKGGNDKNAVMVVYNSFSKIIGSKPNGNMIDNTSGLSKLDVYCFGLFNETLISLIILPHFA